MQLTLLALKDLDAIEDFTGFNFPGAMSKARWMAKLLYAIKMILLASKTLSYLKVVFLLEGSYLNCRDSCSLSYFAMCHGG